MQIQTDSSQKETKEHGIASFPILISAEKLSNYESGSFMWHWHKEIELTLVTKGEMIYQVNNHTFHLKQGQALFGNSGTLHTGCMCESKKDCEYISITFAPQLLYGNENSLIYTNYVKPILQDILCPAILFDLSCDWHKEVIEILKRMIQIEQEKNPAYELDFIQQLIAFWKLLSIHFESTDPLTLQTYQGKTQYDRIRQIILYIETNYASDLTLSDIADYVHISNSVCSRLFKKYMKLSLFEYINQYRIEKSIEYLRHKEFSVTDVARLVGFNDPNYFSKVFHKLMGCAPRDYLSHT